MTSPPSGDPPGPPPGTPPPPPPGPPPATGPPRAAGPPPGSRPAAPSATTPGPREQVQRRTYIILASLLILLLGVGALVFALTRGSDKPVARGPGEVFLQPAAATGPNPFTATGAAAISPSPHPRPPPPRTPASLRARAPAQARPPRRPRPRAARRSFTRCRGGHPAYTGEPTNSAPVTRAFSCATSRPTRKRRSRGVAATASGSTRYPRSLPS